MKDAGNDILKAARSAILGDPWLASQLGTRVFSSWSNQKVASPYIRMAIPSALPFEIEGGGEGSDHDLWVHVYTSEPAPLLCRQIASKVRDVLGKQAPVLDDADLVSIDHRNTRMTGQSVVSGGAGTSESPLSQMAIVQFTVLTTTK